MTDATASASARNTVASGRAQARYASARSGRPISAATGTYSSPAMNRSSRCRAVSSAHCSGGDFIRYADGA